MMGPHELADLRAKVLAIADDILRAEALMDASEKADVRGARDASGQLYRQSTAISSTLCGRLADIADVFEPSREKVA